MTTRLRCAALAALAAAGAACAVIDGHRDVSGTWRLVPAESAIQFVGIKNDSAAVTGSFASLGGAFDSAKRTGWIEVKLGSADTANPERDENIRERFFEVAKYPVARFDVTGLPPAEAFPAPGGAVRIEITGTLSLHGAALALHLPARVWRDGQNHLHLRNDTPLVLSAHDLGMDAQLGALKAVCGHTSLSGVVPLQVELGFAPVAAD